MLLFATSVGLAATAMSWRQASITKVGASIDLPNTAALAQKSVAATAAPTPAARVLADAPVSCARTDIEMLDAQDGRVSSERNTVGSVVGARQEYSRHT